MRLRLPPLPTLALATAVATSAASADEPARYVIDPVHTRVLFAIDHSGYSKALGTVSGSAGTLLFDPEDWSRARLEVSVPMERIDMGDSNWAAAIFAPRFLDVKRYPQARFVSTTITRGDANRGQACGDLTLHGVTRPLCMDLVLNKIGRYPLPPFRRTAGFSARAQLKRSDFGMTSWQSLVGDEVELRIEAELVRRDGDSMPATRPQQESRTDAAEKHP